MWTKITTKHKHIVALKEGLHKMLLKRAIIQLNGSSIRPGFYSFLFLVEKCQNEGIKPPKFKMDMLQWLNTLGKDIKLNRDECPPGAEVPGP